MSGLLSQALTNLLATEQQIMALSGLPAPAQQLQSAASVAILSIVDTVQALQQQIGKFLQNAIPQLNAIESMISSNQPLQQILLALATVQDEISTLNTAVNQANSRIPQIAGEIVSSFKQLPGIENDISTQVVSLTNQLSTDQSEAAAAHQKYLFFLALGVFGVLEAAAALALFLNLTSTVNALAGQISALNANISTLNQMLAATNLLVSDFQALVTRLSSLQNAVNFIDGDLLNIVSNPSAGMPLTTLGIAVTAAITECTVLGMDAS